MSLLNSSNRRKADYEKAEEAEALLREQGNVQIPFPKSLLTAEVKYAFKFARPADITILENSATKTVLSTDDIPTVYLALTMPSVCLVRCDKILLTKNHVGHSPRQRLPKLPIFLQASLLYGMRSRWSFRYLLRSRVVRLQPA